MISPSNKLIRIHEKINQLVIEASILNIPIKELIEQLKEECFKIENKNNERKSK